MNKLELTSKHLMNEIKNGETEETKEVIINSIMKSFACDVLNTVESLRAMNADSKVVKSMVDDYGITLNLKSRKFI